MNKQRIKDHPVKQHPDFEFVGIGGEIKNLKHDFCVFYAGGGPGRKVQPGKIYEDNRVDWLNSPSRHFYKGIAPKSCYDYEWSFQNVILTRFNEETMITWYEKGK